MIRSTVLISTSFTMMLAITLLLLATMNCNIESTQALSIGFFQRVVSPMKGGRRSMNKSNPNSVVATTSLDESNKQQEFPILSRQITSSPSSEVSGVYATDNTRTLQSQLVQEGSQLQPTDGCSSSFNADTYRQQMTNLVYERNLQRCL